MAKAFAVNVPPRKLDGQQMQCGGGAHHRTNHRQPYRDECNGEQSVAARQKKHDEACAQQAGENNVCPIENVEPLQALEHSSENAQRKTQSNGSANDHQKPASTGLKLQGNLE